VFTLTALLSASFLNGRPVYMSDTVTYVEAARSLAAGQGYTVSGAPVTDRPPGYSILLSVLVWLGRDSIASFKILNIAMCTAVSLMWFACLRRVSRVDTALLAAAMASVFFPTIYYTHAVLSETLFALLLSVFVLAALRYAATGRLPWLMAMTGVAMILPLVRYAGVAVFPVWLWVVCIEGTDFGNAWRTKRWNLLAGRIALGLLMTGPFFLWLVRNAAVSGIAMGYKTGVTPEYALSLEKIGVSNFTLGNRIWVNLRGYAHILLIPDQTGIARIGRLPLVVHAACLLCCGLTVLGAVWGFRQRTNRVLAVTALCYMGMLVANTWYDIRYVLPLMPLFFFYLARGVEGVGAFVVSQGERQRPFSKRPLIAPGVWSGAVLTAGVIGCVAFATVSPQAARLRAPDYSGVVQRLYAACQYVKQRPEPGKVLVAGGTGFVPMWSGRPVVSVLTWLDRERNLKIGPLPPDVAFVILDESEFAPYRSKYLEPLVDANANDVDVVFTSGGTLVYGRKETQEHQR
jgi:hypothetical protein